MDEYLYRFYIKYIISNIYGIKEHYFYKKCKKTNNRM